MFVALTGSVACSRVLRINLSRETCANSKIPLLSLGQFKKTAKRFVGRGVGKVNEKIGMFSRMGIEDESIRKSICEAYKRD